MSYHPSPASLAARSLLLRPEKLPLRPPETVAELGRVLVAAPHPDDESLGCGGLLALLAEAGARPVVAFVTDGARSHPGSRTHPPERLRTIREEEAAEALDRLGVGREAARFLRYPDSRLPTPETDAFAEATAVLSDLLLEERPDTLLTPWRRDPHCDHEGSWQLFRAAARQLPVDRRPRWLEYPVWAWAHSSSDRAPCADTGVAWRLDISDVLSKKRAAVYAHETQLGAVTDDPDGFELEEAFVAHFLRPWELFIEPYHPYG